MQREWQKSRGNEREVDLLLFHEACLENVTPLDQIDDHVTAKMMGFWKRTAAETGINILAGRLERQGNKLYNKVTVFTQDGRILADYAKMYHYNQERETLTPGDEKVIFELNGMGLGLMICADFGFPELSRKYVMAEWM